MNYTRFKQFLPFLEKQEKAVKMFLTQAILARACDSGSRHGDMALNGSAAATLADGWSPPIRAGKESKRVALCQAGESNTRSIGSR
jgi:hypothetical protein